MQGKGNLKSVFIKFRYYINTNVIFFLIDYSDSDNDNQGSSEIPESLYNSSNDKLTKLSRKSISHNRSKKNSAIPVSTPKVPFLNGSNKNISFPAEQLNNYPENLDKNGINYNL